MPEKRKRRPPDWAVALLIMAGDYGINWGLLQLFDTRTMVPMIFVLGVFLVSWMTQGYFWGIGASMFSVLAVNYAFTYPYYEIDLWSPECVSSAVVMLVVAVMTSFLTAQLKKTEKLKMEAERERMRGNLLRAVSHDLRTPLTSIYAACSTILEGRDRIPEERQVKLLTDVCSDAQWLVRMVENLLSITRIDGGAFSLNTQDTVVEELIDAVLVKFHKHYPGQTVTLGIPEEFLAIPMDALLLEQVLMNLLENALFHAKGMEHLWLTVERLGAKVRFSVADDGCGIPEERLSGLFTGSLDSQTPKDTGRSNMGIGLSICAAIIKAHGSEIHGANRPAGGAEFWFDLEIKEEDHGQ